MKKTQQLDLFLIKILRFKKVPVGGIKLFIELAKKMDDSGLVSLTIEEKREIIEKISLSGKVKNKTITTTISRRTKELEDKGLLKKLPNGDYQISDDIKEYKKGLDGNKTIFTFAATINTETGEIQSYLSAE